MRRAIILTTLILLLLAVAGVTAAQELRSEAPKNAPETTNPETTAPEATEPDDGEASGVERPDKPGGQTPNGKEANEPGEPNRSRAVEPSDDVAQDPEDSEEDEPNKPDKDANEDAEEKGKPGKARPEIAGRPERDRKVTICHKGKTLTVGAPAEGAHVGHGDSTGACGR